VSKPAASDLLQAVGSWRPEAVSIFKAIVDEFSDVEALNPKAVEHRGCLLNRRALDNPHLEEWFEERFSDAQREYVLNHVHLWDVAWMPDDDARSAELTERLREFMPTLADFWRWSLAKQTGQPVEVWTSDDPEEYGPTIGFGYIR